MQNTIADIGGVLKVITVIGTVLTFIYSRNKYDLDLINSLFYIPNNKEFPFTSKMQKNKTQIVINNINSTSLTNAEMIYMYIKQKEISNICSPGMGIVNKDKKNKNKEDSNDINFQLALQYNKLNKKNKSIVNLSFLELCFLQIKNKKHKERNDLLNKGIKIIMRRLDIINFFIENINFQKIKNLLLTKEQLYLFNCSNKICLGEKINTDLCRDQFVFTSSGSFFSNQSVIDALNPSINQLYL